MSSGIQSHWSFSSKTVALHYIYAGSVRVTINCASINDMLAEEKFASSFFLKIFYACSTCALTCTWKAACLPGLPLCVCVSRSVWTTLQSGCLFLAGRCRLINFDRLPLRPTTNTTCKETRHFHCRVSKSIQPWLVPVQVSIILTINPLKIITSTTATAQLLDSGCPHSFQKKKKKRMLWCYAKFLTDESVNCLRFTYQLDLNLNDAALIETDTCKSRHYFLWCQVFQPCRSVTHYTIAKDKIFKAGESVISCTEHLFTER